MDLKVYPVFGAAALLVAFAAIAGSCVNPCESLQAICDRCLDPNQRASCEATVDEDKNDVCTIGVDSFNNVCK